MTGSEIDYLSLTLFPSKQTIPMVEPQAEQTHVKMYKHIVPFIQVQGCVSLTFHDGNRLTMSVL